MVENFWAWVKSTVRPPSSRVIFRASTLAQKNFVNHSRYRADGWTATADAGVDDTLEVGSDDDSSVPARQQRPEPPLQQRLEKATWKRPEWDVYAREAGLPTLLTHYRPSVYSGHPQNWGVTQRPDGMIYVANNTGVLEYDGQQWRTIRTRTNGFVRSLASDPYGMVWVGLQDDLGYLAPDSIGQLSYHSLYEALPKSQRNIDDVWATHATAEAVYFQTERAIYRWDGEEMTVWSSEERFHTSFLIDGRLFVRQVRKGLLTLEGDSLRLVPGGEAFAQTPLHVLEATAPARSASQASVGLSASGSGRDAPARFLSSFPVLTAISGEGKFYEIDFSRSAQVVRALDAAATAILQEDGVYTGTRLRTGHLAVGTLGRGLFVVTPKGEVVYRLDQSNALPDGIVNHLYLGAEGELWIATNGAGLVKAELPASLSVFDRRLGLSGTVRAISRFRSPEGAQPGGDAGTGGVTSASRPAISPVPPASSAAGRPSADASLGDLFVATAAGLYILQASTSAEMAGGQPPVRFERFKEVPASTWDLNPIASGLAVSTYDGMYLIVDQDDTPVSLSGRPSPQGHEAEPRRRTADPASADVPVLQKYRVHQLVEQRVFTSMESERFPGVLFLGLKDGVGLVRFQEEPSGQLVVSDLELLQGFDEEVRSLVESTSGTLWVSTAGDRVHELFLSERPASSPPSPSPEAGPPRSRVTLTHQRLFDESDGLPSGRLFVTEVQDRILAVGRNGIAFFDRDRDQFRDHAALMEALRRAFGPADGAPYDARPDIPVTRRPASVRAGEPSPGLAIYALTNDFKDRIWVATSLGVVTLEPTSGGAFRSMRLPISSTIESRVPLLYVEPAPLHARASSASSSSASDGTSPSDGRRRGLASAPYGSSREDFKAPLSLQDPYTFWLGDGTEIFRYVPSERFSYEAPARQLKPQLRQIEVIGGPVVATGLSSWETASPNAFWRSSREESLDDVASAIGGMNLPYEHRDIRFTVATPSHAGVGETQYQYRLVHEPLLGVFPWPFANDDWSRWSGANQFSVMNLWEGSYTLQVRSLSNVGSHTQEAVAANLPLTTYSFEISPPLYRTGWAYALYGVLLVGLLLLGRRYNLIYRESRLAGERRRELELQRESLEKERDARQRLEEVNEQLEQVTRLKDDIMASTSHELRTPLTAILGFANVLREEITALRSHDSLEPTEELEDEGASVFPADALERCDEFSSMITSNAQRLLTTVNSIMDLAKIRSGNLEDLPLEPTDIVSIGRSSVQLLRQTAESKGLLLNFDLKDAPQRPDPGHDLDEPAGPQAGPAATGTEQVALLHPNYTERIFENLIANAVKFTDAGGVDITAEEISYCSLKRLEIETHDGGRPITWVDAEGLPVSLQCDQFIADSVRMAIHYSSSDAESLCRDRRFVYITVRDSGQGISEDFFGELFKEFTQESRGNSRLHEGSGLGLSIVAKLAAAQGGRVGISSRKGKGSTFHLAFPLFSLAETIRHLALLGHESVQFDLRGASAGGDAHDGSFEIETWNGGLVTKPSAPMRLAAPVSGRAPSSERAPEAKADSRSPVEAPPGAEKKDSPDESAEQDPSHHSTDSRASGVPPTDGSAGIKNSSVEDETTPTRLARLQRLVEEESGSSEGSDR